MSDETIHILYTNDIHSHFEPMPRIATAIKRFKELVGEHHVLTVDIGDHMDRMRLETEGTMGESNIAVMNRTGYEYAVPGNNEGLTFEQHILGKLYGQDANFTVLGSNMEQISSGRRPDWIQPYAIISKNGYRIGLIGLTAAFNDFYHSLDWVISPPLETAEQYVRILRPQVDLIVVLSHLGLSMDEQMARQIEGIDCIIGGHTHHLLLEPIYLGDTMICAAGKFGRYIGHAAFYFNTTNQKLVKKESSIYETADFSEDEEITEVIRDYKARAKEGLSEKVTVLSAALPHRWNAESELGNLLAEGLRKWTGAEIGMVNSGQLLSSLQEGAVTREILLDICPSPINPCRMTLTGEQIMRILEESLLNEFIDKPIVGYGFRGKVLGTICLDGVEVMYDRDRPPYAKITAVHINGQQMDMHAKYVVGTIDMFTFGVGYMSFTYGEDITFYLPEFLRDLLAVQLQDIEALQHCIVKRWIHI